MQLSFLHNHPNGFFLSPIPCSAREEDLIIPFLITSINNRSKPTIFIVLLVFQLLPTLKPLSILSRVLLSVTMSSKSSKIAKNKHGVKMRGLTKDSIASPSATKNPIPAESKKVLDVQPLQHAISKPIKGDFAKKKFKTCTSKRYRSSLMRDVSIPASDPVSEPEEDALDVDDIIMKTAEKILNETTDQVLRPDVGPDVTTPRNP